MEALALAFSWLRRAPAQASTQATGLKVLLLETPAATADKKAEDFPVQLEAVIISSDPASSVPEYDAPVLEEDDEHDLQGTPDVANLLLQPVTPIELEDSSSPAPPSQLEAVLASSHAAASSVPEYDPPPLPVHNHEDDDNNDDDNLSWEDIQSFFRTWTFPSVQLPSRAESHLEVEELKKLVGKWTWKLLTTLQSIKEEMWNRLLNAGLEEDEVTSQEEQASVFWQRLRGDGTSSVRKHRRSPDKNSERQELVAAMAEESSHKVLKSHAAAGSRKLLRQADVSSTQLQSFGGACEVLKSHAATGFPSQKLLAGGTGDTKEASSNVSPPPASPPPFIEAWARMVGRPRGSTLKRFKKLKRLQYQTLRV
ncbi:hypothetical protein SELMODRAFT_422329 [Selaginella moellendorffii]|uniref:Uncharacterized protein n=1 Tax=Selaginella moellendorffii TaxID=88036 RepID=D8SI24_SELML|nr:hypothetical protein SELMODRAFT_422329 [Selaginella moellendorffii]